MALTEADVVLAQAEVLARTLAVAQQGTLSGAPVSSPSPSPSPSPTP